ncbi:MAG: DegV family protein [Clostridium sp.]
MEKIAIITDSTSDLDRKFVADNNITVLPFRIIYKDREYRDNIDITAQEVYDNIKVEIPTSSLPSMSDIEDGFKRLIKEGYTHAIAITLSTGLSGINNAIKLVSDNFADIQTCVFDSKSISEGEGYIVKEVNKLIQAGKSYNEIVEILPKITESIKVFFIVDTLEYLIKGGRIGKITGAIGTILNLKPIICIGKDGKYFTYDKVRGRKQALKKIQDLAIEFLKNDKKISIYDGNGREEADKLCDELNNWCNANGRGPVKREGSISPVSGVHSGPGLIGIVIID